MEKYKYNLSEITFPIVAIAKGNDLHFARTKDEITICSKLAFRDGFQKDLEIIDADGYCYKVQDAKRIGRVGPFWGFNIFLNPRLRVELSIVSKSDVPVKLTELKQRIITIFKEQQGLWNSGGAMYSKIEFIKKANSHFEIIDKLSNDFYKKY